MTLGTISVLVKVGGMLVDSLVLVGNDTFALTGMSPPLSCQVISGVGNPYEEQLNTASLPSVTVTDCGPVTIRGGTGSQEYITQRNFY